MVDWKDEGKNLVKALGTVVTGVVAYKSSPDLREIIDKSVSETLLYYAILED